MSAVTSLGLPKGLRHARTYDCAVVMYDGVRVAPDGLVTHYSTWSLESPRKRFAHIQWSCWDHDCSLLATWSQTYWNCSSPWCGKHPRHPEHRVGGAHWCLRHAWEHGLTPRGVERSDRSGLRRLP